MTIVLIILAILLVIAILFKIIKQSVKILLTVLLVIAIIATILIGCLNTPERKPLSINVLNYVVQFNNDGSVTTTKQVTTTDIKKVEKRKTK